MKKQLFLYAILLVCTQSYVQNKTPKPNIIYIYADDLGYAELG